MLLRRMMMLSQKLILHFITVVNSVFNFTTRIAANLKSLTVEFSPYQDLHGYNSAWDGGTVANLIPDGKDTSNGYVADKFLDNTGGLVTSNIGYYVSEYFSVTPEATYTYSTNRTSASNPSVAFYDSSYQFISAVAVGSTQVVTIVAPANAAYARASQLSTWEKAGDELFQFEAGATASEIKPYSNICPISGNSGFRITDAGKCIVGGLELLERLKYAMPSGTVNVANGTFAFASSISVSHWIYSYYNYPFKENTQYTFIITYSKSSGGSTNIRVGYTDGTTQNITSSGTTKKSIAFVTTAGKTVRYFGKYTGSGTTTLYYNESGIFEGVLNAADFEQYNGKYRAAYFPFGKNLFDDNKLYTGCSITESGILGNSSSSCYNEIIPVVAGNTYTYSGINGGDANNKRIHGYLDGVWQQQIIMQLVEAGASFSMTFIVPDGVNGIRISAFASDTNRQLELGSSATSYETYNGTVYGGSYEVISGKLIKTKDIAMFDQNGAWSAFGSGGFYINKALNEFHHGSSIGWQEGWFCNRYQYIQQISHSNQISGDGLYNYYSGNATYGHRLVIKDSRFSTLEAFKASLAETPIVVCAPLASSVEYNFQPSVINTLIGTNTIWYSDYFSEIPNDSMSIEYYDNQ